MLIEQFTSTAIALLRSAVGWQSAIARRLEVDPRTVRRWIKEGKAPDWVDAKMAELIGAADLKTPWPRDEWMIGDAIGETGQRREYIAHLQPPRFIARIVDLDEYGEPIESERPADMVSGVVYNSDDQAFCEIVWIDEPSPGEIAQLLDAAADAVIYYDTD